MNQMVRFFIGLCVLISFVSCDKEFDEVGSSILDGNIYNYQSDTFSVTTTTTPTGAVETSRLLVNSLGEYNHPLFGEMNHSFVTQLELAEENLIISEDQNPTIKSVKLNVPYFSTLLSRDSENNGTYRLDSIYGDESAMFDLSVYESGYNMSNSVKFYSDEVHKIQNNIIGTKLNTSPLLDQNINFVYNKKEIAIKDASGAITKYLSPQMYLDLDVAYFQNKIFKSGKDVLINNNNFQGHFKGLYFQTVLKNKSKSNLMHLNFAKGEIEITYTVLVDKVPVDKIMLLKLKGNTANFFTPTTYMVPENRMLLKGGEGTMIALKLFAGDGELNKLKSKNLLINEANLVFHVDETAMKDVVNEPKRVYLFQKDISTTLVDYQTDFTTSSALKGSKMLFGGNAVYNSSKKVTSYKVRITKHVDNIINKDSTNTTLMLSLTDDVITSITNRNKENKINVPMSHVISPFGTVLYNENELSDKKLKLEIFYSTTKK